jgi:hypothetical protein
MESSVMDIAAIPQVFLDDTAIAESVDLERRVQALNQ